MRHLHATSVQSDATEVQHGISASKCAKKKVLHKELQSEYGAEHFTVAK